jgi:hypothetical protein
MNPDQPRDAWRQKRAARIAAEPADRHQQTAAEIHLDELRQLTECRCDPAWTNRGRHEPHCVWDYREDVDALRVALAAAEQRGRDQLARRIEALVAEWDLTAHGEEASRAVAMWECAAAVRAALEDR